MVSWPQPRTGGGVSPNTRRPGGLALLNGEGDDPVLSSSYSLELLSKILKIPPPLPPFTPDQQRADLGESTTLTLRSTGPCLPPLMAH